MTTSSSRRKQRSDTGVVIVPRDRKLFRTLYYVPLTRAQIEARHFADITHKPGHWHGIPASRRLTKLTRAGYVYRRRLPHLQTAGSAQYCYSLGVNAVPYVATDLDIPQDRVKHRQEQDARASLLTYPHRALTAETYLALYTGCEARGFALIWTPEHELTPAAVAYQGKRLPVRPDGAVLLSGLPQGSSFAYLEIQVASDPSKFVRKALAYALFYRSGQYQERTGRKSFRVLTITTSQPRATNLCAAVAGDAEVRAVGGLDRFWFTWQEALADVWGLVWLRADQATDTRYAVLG